MCNVCQVAACTAEDNSNVLLCGNATVPVVANTSGLLWLTMKCFHFYALVHHGKIKECFAVAVDSLLVSRCRLCGYDVF